MSKPELWIGTTNIGKLREFEKLLSDKFEIHSVKELAAYHPPDETGKTFLENARIKAKSIRSIKPQAWVVADDSGIIVDGLGGLPGVHSSSYAGPTAKDIEHCLKVIKMLHLKAAPTRKARMVCNLVAFSPEGKEYVSEGVLEGNISKNMKGTEGFGYDPVFIPDGHEQTLAELGLAKKNQLSHRARAIEKLITLIS